MKTSFLRYGLILFLVLTIGYSAYLFYHFLEINENGSTFLHIITILVLDAFICIEIFLLIRGIISKNEELVIHPIAYEGQKVNTPPLIANIIGLVLFLAGTILCSIFGYSQFEATKGCNLLVVSLISIFGLINVKAYFTYLIINRIKQKDIYKIIK